MPFEQYTGAVNTRSLDPVMAISKNGTFRFNMPAVKALNLKSYKYAVFYYDKEEKRISIELTHSTAKQGTYTLRFKKDGYGADISASAFLRHIKYDYSESKRFNLYHDGNSGLLVCDL